MRKRAEEGRGRAYYSLIFTRFSPGVYGDETVFPAFRQETVRSQLGEELDVPSVSIGDADTWVVHGEVICGRDVLEDDVPC